MEHLPVYLSVLGRRAVIVGGGVQAARKAELLHRAGAEITVIAEGLDEDLQRMIENCQAVQEAGPLTADKLQDCVLAIGASPEPAENEELHRMASAANVPVNVVDRNDLCSFIMPAVVDRSPIVVAISSGGKAPIIARILKSQLESLIPTTYGWIAEFAGSWRDRVTDSLHTPTSRLRFWEGITSGQIPEALAAGNNQTAENLMAESLEDAARDSQRQPAGEVYLVGAGPGDPELLTFRALRLMQQTDVVLYDRLIGDGILNLVRRDAERIYVGKMPKEHALPQEEISVLMIKLAKQGKRVLRLKGGDPFIFGRGGEEIEALAHEGIAFQVVPGITAASGCASYAGIPLTHRDHAQACVFVTGHGKDGGTGLDWPSLTVPNRTLVIYMGLSALEQITSEYVSHGGDAAMPAAIVENGTHRDQRVVTGTVGTLANKVSKADIAHPALIIIGTVVTLRENLAWHAKETAVEISPGALGHTPKS